MRILNALTIDVEDYYQVSAFESVVPFEKWGSYESRVEANTFQILDLLEKYKTKATFFVLGWVAERHPHLLRAIDQRGHEIASHGYSHRLVYRQTPSEFREETKRSKASIEQIIQKPVLGYRAASYSITARSLWALDILAEEGFRYDSSIFPIRHDCYGIPGSRRFPYEIVSNGQTPLVEFPLTTLRLGPLTLPIAGGGYLRLFPMRFFEWAIRQYHKKEHQPAVIYFHPWELDEDQPRISASLLSRFRHYLNLDKTENRISGLLSSFQFGPMLEVLRMLGFLIEPGARVKSRTAEPLAG